MPYLRRFTVLTTPSVVIAALGLVAGASAGAIATAWGVSAVLPAERLPQVPAELLARTTPTLPDFGIGIAAGAAGAYVTVRFTRRNDIRATGTP